MKLRYQYRFYPTNQQRQGLAQLFGCVRVVWNDALAFCKDSEKLPSYNALSKRLTECKQTEEKIWLTDVSAVPLQQSIRNLSAAYKNFFDSVNGKRKGKKVNPPKFKSRRSKQSATFTSAGFVLKDNDRIYLAKIGFLDVVWSRPLPSIPSSVTVIKDRANRYFLSFVVEVDPQQLADNGQSVGIDLGIIDFATLSTGEKIKSPKPLKAKLKRLRKCQRNLARKQKGSKRREKARLRVAKVHAKVKDTRTDFLHKLSTRLIRENQTVILEDLNTAGMMKNRRLSRAISDLGWRSFRTILEAKAVMYGREFRTISRWEPTSQRCSCCGEIGGKKELSVREWTCLFCGANHDRDINAATNILVAGGHSETKNGRGGKRQTTSVAASGEASTHRKAIQLTLFAS
ncbi:transposase [Synechocystis sp. PCC 6803]|uniref:Transposase n=1 Tax=Synechocystis sp. (strain ATCC 27184 / PCC 6803 / Kazusa) TaxID=1111708 RepID=P73816_SYNY3|nr:MULTISPECIES: RNA-guided endonuclease TnpB family protein [unclassified Synechocystis]BAM51623.1 transposase [Synechocystis sp. PCC 6803] [Bacillus subtilis BEST7613]AGF51558.1 transposase [Synechocystis sp. PCC 6803]ALJ67554.1 transposase [Synechocystis sp. PCC 6803]AVP89399.1 transposase [Synechocystis sp. IPPAS B-1465]MBD2618517.1 IS200/IS605 family element transposase accessory protein TnpB [Synechocystis sp. FACHB-898]